VTRWSVLLLLVPTVTASAEAQVAPCEAYDVEGLAEALRLELSGSHSSLRVELLPCAETPDRVRIVDAHGRRAEVVVVESAPRFIALAIAEHLRALGSAPTVAAEPASAAVVEPTRAWTDDRPEATPADQRAWYPSASLLSIPRRDVTILRVNAKVGYGTDLILGGRAALWHRLEAPWSLGVSVDPVSVGWSGARRAAAVLGRATVSYEDDLLILGAHAGMFWQGVEQGGAAFQPTVGLRAGFGAPDLIALYADVEIQLPVGGPLGLASAQVALDLRVAPTALVRMRIDGATRPLRLGFESELLLFLTGEGGAGSVGVSFGIGGDVLEVPPPVCEFGPCPGRDAATDGLFAVTANLGTEVRW
jgi:hypothetical protein